MSRNSWNRFFYDRCSAGGEAGGEVWEF